MFIMQQYQRVWRDVAMDGRSLPAKVDARGFPDARFYGYSVGHWDGDYTFVIDTTGVDDRTWLDEGGTSTQHRRSRSRSATRVWTSITFNSS